jgi:DNA-binding XRE family transcriptional regulator
MDTGVIAQRAALEQLWPQIRGYCDRNRTYQYQLITGRHGVPVDGRKLTLLRGERLLTRQELAKAAGLSLDMVAKIENGVRSPSPAVLAELLKVLRCKPSALFRED